MCFNSAKTSLTEPNFNLFLADSPKPKALHADSPKPKALHAALEKNKALRFEEPASYPNDWFYIYKKLPDEVLNSPYVPEEAYFLKSRATALEEAKKKTGSTIDFDFTGNVHKLNILSNYPTENRTS